ncbi:MAG: winged helix-turn-helix transcriptional regulator [Phascolarctobacterium faecium]
MTCCVTSARWRIHYLHDLHFKELALQRGRFIFLTRICENTGINQNDLSLLLKVDKSTTAKAVQKLTAAGYINEQRKRRPAALAAFPTEKALLLYDQIITEENTSLQLCLQILQRQNAKN